MEEKSCRVGRCFIRGFVVLVKDLPPHVDRVNHMGVVDVFNLLKLA